MILIFVCFVVWIFIFEFFINSILCLFNWSFLMVRFKGVGFGFLGILGCFLIIILNIFLK